MGGSQDGIRVISPGTIGTERHSSQSHWASRVCSLKTSARVLGPYCKSRTGILSEQLLDALQRKLAAVGEWFRGEFWVFDWLAAIILNNARYFKLNP